MHLRVFLLLLAAALPARAAEVDYLRQVKPLLKQRCYACHAALKQKSNLRLDTSASIQKGGDLGPALIPGKPGESEILKRVASTGPDRMPPEGEGTPLSSAERELLKRWIAEGAKGPADDTPEVSPREHWSYKRPQKPSLPVLKSAADVRTPVDVFLAARHEQLGLKPQPEAPKHVWLRRVYLDLIGVPPTREELHAFLADDAPDAYERVVDDLLSRPQHGERWGRHWMDVWRYSDWYGSRAINEIRYSQRGIWRWRDWIVDSLNADAPYDQMLQQMLAGDELAPADPQVLRATGFLGRNWYKFDRNVWMFDAVEHTAQAFLGLTLRCCRCHDHKYDPISHEDYYRFRAFFEPHDVRTDKLSPDEPMEKDATLGQVFSNGLPRIYDKQLDAPTFVFLRGDNRAPDKTRPLSPGIPDAFGLPLGEIQPVPLPPESFYPALKSRDELLAKADAQVQAATAFIAAARKTAEMARQKVDDALAKGETTAPVERPPVFHDDFSKARPDTWQSLGGTWVYENGHLKQTALGGFHTFVSRTNHPRDFQATLKYRSLENGSLRSIGFSYDFLDTGNSQDVYTHVNANSQGVQAFHRLNGQQNYPQAGVVKTDSLKVGDLITLEISVRSSQLTISVNGQKKLDYVLPTPRRDGKFAIWTLEATAEFEELTIRDYPLTLADLKLEHQLALDGIALAEAKLVTAVAERDALRARIDAELAKYSLPKKPDADVQPLALAASRAEARVAVCKADESVLQAQQHVARTQSLSPAVEGLPEPAAVVEAKKQLAAALQTKLQAEQAGNQPSEKYVPLGDLFPATSTGRRLALARWIASDLNPRTARVAVNQIWMRHFGQPLVPTVDNFGLNGQPPVHPQLLDWLAVDLMENGWRMKRLHKLIVLSAAYRRSSLETLDDPNLAIDPDNRHLWRMNSRRLEAEAVRDSVFACAGSLDPRMGGPEIPEASGQLVSRRSLYFRLTPNDKMKFLELFDAADPNACYRRRESVVPQQALAFMNSAIPLDQARLLASRLSREVGPADDDSHRRAFLTAAFETVLSRPPTDAELRACLKYLEQPPIGGTPFPAGGQSQRSASTDPSLRARENLIHVLFCHNDFVTVR